MRMVENKSPKKKKLGQCEKHIDYERKRALRWIMLCSEIFVKLNAFVLYLPYLALRERERDRLWGQIQILRNVGKMKSDFWFLRPWKSEDG